MFGKTDKAGTKPPIFAQTIAKGPFWMYSGLFFFPVFGGIFALLCAVHMRRGKRGPKNPKKAPPTPQRGVFRYIFKKTYLKKTLLYFSIFFFMGHFTQEI